MKGDPVGWVLFGAAETGGAVPEKTLRDDQVLKTVMLTLFDNHVVTFDGAALVGKADVKFPAEPVDAPDARVTEALLKPDDRAEAKVDDIALVADVLETEECVAPVDSNELLYVAEDREVVLCAIETIDEDVKRVMLLLVHIVD